MDIISECCGADIDRKGLCSECLEHCVGQEVEDSLDELNNEESKILISKL